MSAKLSRLFAVSGVDSGWLAELDALALDDAEELWLLAELAELEAALELEG